MSSTAPVTTAYPATLELDYQDKLSRVTTIFRLILVIPIAIILGILTSGSESIITTVIKTARSSAPPRTPAPASRDRCSS